MKMPTMKGLKGGLRTLVMGATAIGLVGLMVYAPINLAAAQTGAMANSISGLLNNLPIGPSGAADIMTIGAGVLTLGLGGMILNADKKRKMFSAKTQNMLMPALAIGVSLNTASKLQSYNVGSAFSKFASGQPVAALNNFKNGAYAISAPVVVQNQATQGARLGLGSNMYGSAGANNALYQNNSANAGRIFGSRLGSAKRKVNLF